MRELSSIHIKLFHSYSLGSPLIVYIFNILLNFTNFNLYMNCFESESPSNLKDNEIVTPLLLNINLSNGNNTSLPPKRKASKDTSPVWKLFTKKDGCLLSNLKARCNYCHKTYSCHPKNTAHQIYCIILVFVSKTLIALDSRINKI